MAIEPSGAYFGSVYGSQPRTRVLTIDNNGDTPLKLAVDPMSSNGPFKFDLAEKVPGQSFELTVTFAPAGLKPGMVQGKGTLLTNMEAQRQLEISASATLRDRIEVEPSTLSVFAPTSQPMVGQQAFAPTTRTLRLRNYGEKPVKALEVSADDPALQVSLKEDTPGRAYTIQVSTPVGYVLPPTGRTITVKTNDPEKAIVKVPVQKGQAGGCGSGSGTARGSSPQHEKIGKDAPAFSLTTLTGKTVSSKEIKGKVTVLDFYATTCGHCKKQLPRVEALRPAYEAKGVRFLCVTEMMGKTPATREDVVAKMQELGVKADVAIDADNTVGKLFETNGFPTMCIVDKAGKIAAVNVGNVDDLETRMKTQLDALVAGKDIPTLSMNR